MNRDPELYGSKGLSAALYHIFKFATYVVIAYIIIVFLGTLLGRLFIGMGLVDLGISILEVVDFAIQILQTTFKYLVG